MGAALWVRSHTHDSMTWSSSGVNMVAWWHGATVARWYGATMARQLLLLLAVQRQHSSDDNAL